MSNARPFQVHGPAGMASAHRTQGVAERRAERESGKRHDTRTVVLVSVFGTAAPRLIATFAAGVRVGARVFVG